MTGYSTAGRRPAVSKATERFQRVEELEAKPSEFPSAEELDDALGVLQDADEYGVVAILSRVCRVLAAGEPGTVSYENIGRLAVFVRDAHLVIDSIGEDLAILDKSLPLCDEIIREGGRISIPADAALRHRLMAAGAEG
jgi:hypothetical protein